jgi:hypothetical protein
MRRSSTACNAIAATAVETAGTHATSMKSSASKPTTTTTTAATGKSVVGDKAYANQNKCCQSSENAPKHGVPPLFRVPRIAQGDAAHEDRHLAKNFASHRVPN